MPQLSSLLSILLKGLCAVVGIGTTPVLHSVLTKIVHIVQIGAELCDQLPLCVLLYQ